MKKLNISAKSILATLASFVIGTSVVAECNNGGKIRWEPKVPVVAGAVVE